MNLPFNHHLKVETTGTYGTISIKVVANLVLFAFFSVDKEFSFLINGTGYGTGTGIVTGYPVLSSYALFLKKAAPFPRARKCL